MMISALQALLYDDPAEDRPTTRVEVTEWDPRPLDAGPAGAGHRPDSETARSLLRQPLEELGQRIRIACSAADGIWVPASGGRMS